MRNNAPRPDYEYEIERIVSVYRDAITEILRRLERMDLTDMTRAQSAAVLAEVAKILAETNETSAKWVERHITQAARDGVIDTLLALKVAKTAGEARKVATLNRVNKALVDAVIADTQSDLLAVTQNVERKVRTAVRQVTAEAMSANMASGVFGRRTIDRDIINGLYSTLGKSVETGIIDAAGRRWKPEVYVDMVTRTKTMEARNQAQRNEAIAQNTYYGIISSHGAVDACRFHEGRIVKLIPNAPGDYPTVEELRASGEIFHPNCRHVVTPVRDPDKLPKQVVVDSEIQDINSQHRELIRSGFYPLNVNEQKQNRHVEDTYEHRDYIERNKRKGIKDLPSILTVGASVLVQKYSGKGDILIKQRHGRDEVTEFFTHKEIIGYYFDNNTGEKVYTNRGGIRYSSTGTHVFPVMKRRGRR